MAKYGNGEDTPAGGADSATNIYNSVQSANSSSNQPQSDAALNLADFALGQDFAEHAAQKIIVSVPVRRPDRKVFFRTHPDPSYRYATRVLEIPGERDAYLVHPRLQSIVAEAVPVLIITCIDRSGNVFFWPIKLPRNDMMSTSWADGSKHPFCGNITGGIAEERKPAIDRAQVHFRTGMASSGAKRRPRSDFNSKCNIVRSR